MLHNSIGGPPGILTDGFGLTFRMAQLFHLYAELRTFLIKMASLQAECLSRFRHIVARALQFGKNRRPFEGFNPG
jgi:hypothetical protein